MICRAPSRIFRLGLLAAALFLAVPGARAQSPADINSAAQESERIQREQLQRQQEDINRDLGPTRPQTVITVPAPPTQQGHGAGCRYIKRIEFKSTVHMSRPEFLKLAVPYAGRCLGVDEIQTLLSEVTRFYVDKGYVTTRVYLAPQDLSTGTLRIKVVAGKVSDLKIDSSKTNLRYVGNVFPDTVDQDLDLRDFEQGVDQLNRLTSNNASIDIQPGAAPGESTVVIKNNPTKPWHVNMTADNYGTRSTGRDQLGATASIDNLTGLNDFLSVTRRKTIPFGDGSKQSTSTSVLSSVPYGYATLTAGVTGSNYDSTLLTPGGTTLHLNGDDRVIFATLDDVVYRNQTGKASLNATLTNEATNNFIADQKLSVSSRTLTFLQLGASCDTALAGGTATLGANYVRGLNIFDALQDPSGLPAFVPHAQFNKFTFAAGYTRPFAVEQQKLVFSSQFSGQYALDTLYGSQQFSVGGMYTVRGFFEEALANDDGYYLRNDLTLMKTLGTIYGQTVGFKPFVALDVGSVGSRTAPGTPHGTLAGTAAGFDLQSGPLDFNIFLGYPLLFPATVFNERFNTFARLSVTF